MVSQAFAFLRGASSALARTIAGAAALVLAAGVAIALPKPPASVVGPTETVLYTFQGGSDGADPYAGLIFDTSGALYGTTKLGGIGNGTVFELK